MRWSLSIILLLITYPLVASEKLPPAIKHIEDLGNKVTYAGQVYGLQSYVIEKPNTGDIQIFYVTPDGQAAIGGIMSDTQGRSVTRTQLMNYIKLNDNREINIVEENGLRYGDKGPVLVAFLSPTCRNCRQFWKDVGPKILEGQLQVIALPIASGESPDEVRRSLQIAASIVETNTPADKFVAVSVTGNLDGLLQPSRASINMIEQNQALHAAMSFDKTPAFLAKLPTGEAIKANGWPIDLRNLLPNYNPD